MSADTTAQTALVVHRADADRRVEEARTRLQLARKRTRVTLNALQVEVKETLSEFKEEVKERTDWHTYFRARPAAFLAAAFVVGFFLARRR